MSVTAKPFFAKSLASKVVLLVSASALLVGAGWGAAVLFRSPEQIAADSQAPPPSVVTADVVIGDLGRAITIRGQVELTEQQDLVMPSSPYDTLAVVTRALVSTGDTVHDGGLVAEINGAPLFAIRGDFPFYRDLRFGDRGPDVEQLQHALAASGFNELEVDGVLGSQTEDAVRVLLARAGFDGARSPLHALPVTNSETGDAEGNASEESELPWASRIVFPRHLALVSETLPAVVVVAPDVGLLDDSNSVVTLASGSPKVVTPVSAATAAQIKVGLVGEIVDGSGIGRSLAVTTVPTIVNDDGAVEVLLESKESFGLDEVGSDVTVAITLDAGVEMSLIVPSRAVAVRGDGYSVRVMNADGTINEVDVIEVATSLGQSAVRPTEPDTLSAGDRVVVE